MNPELRIGLVDSGCTAEQATALAAGRRFWLEQGELCQGPLRDDRLGHGSAVLATLAQDLRQPQLLLAQVFDERWATSALQVAGALYWLVEQGARVINLSLGLRQDRPLLREACQHALEAGVLLCASSPARGEAVFPASYPGVIRVTGDARCSPGQWSWLGSAQADFGAPVRAGSGLAGASLACAALSGGIAAFLQRQPRAGRREVLDYLAAGAAYLGPERKGMEHA